MQRFNCTTAAAAAAVPVGAQTDHHSYELTLVCGFLGVRFDSKLRVDIGIAFFFTITHKCAWAPQQPGKRAGTPPAAAHIASASGM